MSVRFVPFFLAAMFFVAGASAQTTRIGVMMGYNTDVDEVTLGLNGHVGFEVGDREVIAGIVAELFPFISGRTVTMIDADALFPADLGKLGLYGGGGLTLRHIAREVGPSDTDIGFNVKGGAFFESDSRGWVPFLELVQTIGADTDFTVRGGVFFRIGGR